MPLLMMLSLMMPPGADNDAAIDYAADDAADRCQ